jgi:putative tryptophan/tyrosine transport system substrate-binding protein
VRESAPHVTRVAVLRDATTPQGIGLFAVIRGIASALGLELRPIGLRDADEIERGITAFVREGDGGLRLCRWLLQRMIASMAISSR